MKTELLNSLFVIKSENSDDVTHFVVPNGKCPKFLIDARYSKSFKHILSCIMPYSMKMEFVKLFFKYGPMNLKKKLLRRVAIDSEILEYLINLGFLSRSDNFNILIGTYGPHQKITVQVLRKKKAFYIKIGTEKTKELIKNEVKTLLKLNSCNLEFNLPKILDSADFPDFSAIVLDEFKGNKQKPVISDQIIRTFNNIQSINLNKPEIQNKINKRKELYRALTGKDIELSYSHGDFTPWNIRKMNTQLLLFDWEYADIRFSGYDLIHYIFQINFLLKKMKWIDALRDATKKFKVISFLKDNKETYLGLLYLKERTLTYQTDFDRKIFRIYLEEVM